MLIEVPEIHLVNVWKEEGTDRQTGEQFGWNSAQLSKPGEAPLQLSVQEKDYEELYESIGVTGTAVIDLDAQPNRRKRVYLRAMR